MILLVLAGIWLLVLLPGYLRRRSERDGDGSIDSFHHQLHLLEHTGPKIIEPAHRLESAFATTGLAACESGYPAVSSMPGRPNLVLISSDSVVTSLEPIETYAPVSSSRVRDPYRQRQARQRRQRILALLVATVVGTGGLGFAPKYHALWIAAGISGAILMGFIGLLVYAQRLNAEIRAQRLAERQWRAQAAGEYSRPEYGDYGEEAEELVAALR